MRKKVPSEKQKKKEISKKIKAMMQGKSGLCPHSGELLAKQKKELEDFELNGSVHIFTDKFRPEMDTKSEGTSEMSTQPFNFSLPVPQLPTSFPAVEPATQMQDVQFK